VEEEKESSRWGSRRGSGSGRGVSSGGTTKDGKPRSDLKNCIVGEVGRFSIPPLPSSLSSGKWEIYPGSKSDTDEDNLLLSLSAKERKLTLSTRPGSEWKLGSQSGVTGTLPPPRPMSPPATVEDVALDRHDGVSESGRGKGGDMNDDSAEYGDGEDGTNVNVGRDLRVGETVPELGKGRAGSVDGLWESGEWV